MLQLVVEHAGKKVNYRSAEGETTVCFGQSKKKLRYS